MGQAIKTPPRTVKEYRRQKGPVPMIAVIMALCLLGACLFFFGPAIVGTVNPAPVAETPQTGANPGAN